MGDLKAAHSEEELKDSHLFNIGEFRSPKDEELLGLNCVTVLIEYNDSRNSLIDIQM